MCEECNADLSSLDAEERARDIRIVLEAASSLIVSFPPTPHGLLLIEAVSRAVKQAVAVVWERSQTDSLTPAMQEYANEISKKAYETLEAVVLGHQKDSGEDYVH